MSQIYADSNKLYAKREEWTGILAQRRAQELAHNLPTPEGLPDGGAYKTRDYERTDGTFLITLQYRVAISGTMRHVTIGSYISGTPADREMHSVVRTAGKIVHIGGSSDNGYDMIVGLCPKGMPWPVHTEATTAPKQAL